jgi:CubicO group peptidase (beta-lactamase class C family)
MYLVAGMIIEKVTHQPWDDFIKSKIFIPLAMTHSSTNLSGLMKDNNYARPHLKNQPITPVTTDNIAPAGSINSNIDEMLVWMRLWLNEGRFEGNEILSEKTFSVITTPKVILSDHSTESYGFGWYIDIDDGKQVLSHGGGMPGYKSLILLFPKSKSGIVILTNKISYLNETLAGVITEYLDTGKLNFKAADNAYGRNFNFPWDDETDTGNLESIVPAFSQYQGIYEDRSYGKAKIENRAGKPILKFLPANEQLSGKLYYKDKNTLKIIFNDGFIPAGDIIFERDNKQQVKGFRMDIATSDFHFKYLYFKKK